MVNEHKIGVRMFAVEFYRANASLFFLIITFAGGFMRSHDHLALGEFFVATPYLAVIPIAAWTAYCLFVVDFNVKTLAGHTSNFLSCFSLLSQRFQWSFCGLIVAFQLAPMFAYATFLIALASKNADLDSGALILLASTILFSACTYILRATLSRSREISRPIIARLGLDRFSKPYQLILIHAVMSRRFFAVTGYKIASIILVWATMLLYGTDSYDWRLFALACTIAFSASISFVYEWHAFELSAFSLFRRMPFSLLKRLGYTISIITIFCLPEILLILKNAPSSLSNLELVQIVLYGLSIVFVWYTFLFTSHRKFETVMSYVSFTTISYFVMILANIPVWGLLLLNLTAGLFFYFQYYDRFEYEVSA